MAVRVGIDTGGTFTDIVVLDETGRATQFKVPSTPDDPARALVEGVSRVSGDIASIAHGTTVATNAMLEERFQELALFTTQGFRHTSSRSPARAFPAATATPTSGSSRSGSFRSSESARWASGSTSAARS